MDTDGRPTADEAWAMLPRSEVESACITGEMMAAWPVSRGSKSRFTSYYNGTVARNRSAGIDVWWRMSLGADPLGQERALRDAVAKKRITREYALRIDGSLVFEEVE